MAVGGYGWLWVAVGGGLVGGGLVGDGLVGSGLVGGECDWMGTWGWWLLGV